MSEILINPTYLDLLHVADKEIETTQDLEHIYFEGMHVMKQVNKELHQIELMLGSWFYTAAIYCVKSKWILLLLFNQSITISFLFLICESVSDFNHLYLHSLQ